MPTVGRPGYTYYSTKVGGDWTDGLNAFLSSGGALTLSSLTGLTNAITAANTAASQSAATPPSWSLTRTVCPQTTPPSYLGAYLGYADTPCYLCPFPSPPANNGTFAPLTTPYSLASCAASPRCASTAYYLNRTQWACQSCTARARAICASSNYYILAGGCGGVDTPFNALSPASDCTTCTIDPSTLVPRVQYLLTTSTPCEAKPCSITATQYWSSPCGGTSAGVATPCPGISNPCPIGYWLSDPSIQCGPTTGGWGCSPCSYGGQPGYSYTASGNCTQTHDVQLTPCPLNYYCTGGTAPPQPCPTGMQSTEGTTSLLGCFCPIGMIGATNTTCARLSCPGSAPWAGPGAALTSPSYIAQVRPRAAAPLWPALQPSCSSPLARAAA